MDKFKEQLGVFKKKLPLFLCMLLYILMHIKYPLFVYMSQYAARKIRLTLSWFHVRCELTAWPMAASNTFTLIALNYSLLAINTRH
jgi:hypothetical protein